MEKLRIICSKKEDAESFAASFISSGFAIQKPLKWSWWRFRWVIHLIKPSDK